MRYGIVLMACLGVGLSACGGKKKYEFTAEQGRAVNDKSGKGLVGEVKWLKNKRDTIDVDMTLENKYGFPIRVPYENVSLTFNGIPAQRVGSYNIRTELPVNFSESDVVIFHFKPEIGQHGKVVLKFDNITSADEAAKKLPPLVFNFDI